jgi:hypothetical protein
MPVKRRRDKARKQLDTMDIEDLFYGPGACLFNGEGYLGPHGDGRCNGWAKQPRDEYDRMTADAERLSKLGVLELVAAKPVRMSSAAKPSRASRTSKRK